MDSREKSTGKNSGNFFKNWVENFGNFGKSLKTPYGIFSFAILITGGIFGGILGAISGAFVYHVITTKIEPNPNLPNFKKWLLAFGVLILGILLYFVLSFGFMLLTGKIFLSPEAITTSEQCERVYTSIRDTCYMNLAINTKNAAFCERVLNQTGEYDSRDSCYGNLAEIQKDPSLCSRIQTIQRSTGMGTRDTCYHNLAIALNDANLCKNIQQNTDIVSQDACFQNVAVSNKHSALCEKIQKQSDPDPQIPSKENCYGGLGVILKDRVLCQKAGVFMQECLERSG